MQYGINYIIICWCSSITSGRWCVVCGQGEVEVEVEEVKIENEITCFNRGDL